MIPALPCLLHKEVSTRDYLEQVALSLLKHQGSSEQQNPGDRPL